MASKTSYIRNWFMEIVRFGVENVEAWVEKVSEVFCLCDTHAYIKARNGVVYYPEKYAGRRLEEVLAEYGGVKLLAEDPSGEVRVFVVRKAAAAQKPLFRVEYRPLEAEASQ